MEGLDGERPLQTREVVIIVVLLLMWAGEYWMGSQGLGSMIMGSGEGYPSGEKGEKRSVCVWGGNGWWREVIRTSLGRKREGYCKARVDGCTGPRDSRIF